MKMFTCNDSRLGMYPVGFSAIVVAENKTIAAEMLTTELHKRNITTEIATESVMTEFDPSVTGVTILVTGDY